jgi:hypothetical protein
VLGYAGGGQLGNFGEVGVDQTTFGPAVFLWFVSIGGLTVAMTGGITRRAKPAPVATPAPVVVEEPPYDEPPAEEPPADEPPDDDVDEYDVVEEIPDPPAEPAPAAPVLDDVPRVVGYDDLDDPEAHFVTDDDAEISEISEPDATSDEARRPAD